MRNNSDKEETKVNTSVNNGANKNQNQWIGCPIGVNPQQGEFKFEDFTIDSMFDEGNIMNVQKVEPYHYSLNICADCFGTNKETKNKTWFYFRVSSIKVSGIYTFTIKNMNNQTKLFNEGMLPVYKTLPSSPKWKKIPPQTLGILPSDKGVEVSFNFNVDNEESEIYLAYTWPWSYEDDIKQMDELQEKLKNDDEVYFVRELLISTRENRRIDLLTITNKNNITDKREKVHPFLFPNASHEPRPFMFEKKKYVFVSSRVHPGENSAAYVFNGLIRFLCEKNDVRARQLRENFVFIMIPNLNPDAVYRGHYRADPLGQNLNRYYINPSPQEQPSIYATKQIVVDLSQTNRLFLYVDLHAHATKRGTFVYGNNLDYRQQVEYRLFPKLLSLNSRIFDYEACNFSDKNVMSAKKGELNKEGAGRVALWKATGLIQCYTLECNFNGGALYNVLSEPATQEKVEEEKLVKKDTDWDQINQDTIIPQPSEYYNPELFEEVGEAIGVSLLDMCELNPLSRIKSSVYKNLRNIKLHVALGLIKQAPFRFDAYLRKLNKNMEKNLEALLLFIDKNVKIDMEQKPTTTGRPKPKTGSKDHDRSNSSSNNSGTENPPVAVKRTFMTKGSLPLPPREVRMVDMKFENPPRKERQSTSVNIKERKSTSVTAKPHVNNLTPIFANPPETQAILRPRIHVIIKGKQKQKIKVF
jgi:hypothetical protein